MGEMIQYIAKGEKMGDEEGAPHGEEGHTTWRGNTCQVWGVWLPPLPHIPKLTTSQILMGYGCATSQEVGFPHENAPPLKRGTPPTLAHA